MTDWLKKRLTMVKGEEPRWEQFAESLQELWETEFDGELARMANARSVFTAHDDDVVKAMGELGDYFRDDIGKVYDRPIQVVWRRLELQGKETERLINMAMRRKFYGIDIQWIQLYAHKVDAYGTNFKTSDEIDNLGLSMADFFLTSRGRVRLASRTLEDAGVDFPTFFAAVEYEIERFLPTHIVYDGAEFEQESADMNIYFGGGVCEGTYEYLEMTPEIEID